jgi:glutamate racemase
MNPQPIGIFDSGFGGLTVMKAIGDLLPSEHIIYFGDTARLPYGTKSGETILRYSIENASFLIQQGIKVLVVACHTACSFALDELQKKFDIPIIGVTTAAIDQVRRCSTRGKIAVIGTRGTIASGTYPQLIRNILPSAEVTAIACQLLVALVEEGYITHPMTEMAISEYLHPLKDSDIDTLILGCTHFPLLQYQIQKILDPNVEVIDPGRSCAALLKHLLEKEQLLNRDEGQASTQFYVSDDPEKFSLLGDRFLGRPVKDVISIQNINVTYEF